MMSQKAMSTSDIPVVFLHGFSGQGQSLEPFAKAHSGRAAVCIDLPGFGTTPAPSEAALQDFTLYTEVVWRHIRTIVPTGSLVLVGHSYGAMVAFTLACRHRKSIIRVDLYCPVATPRLGTRFIVAVARFAYRLHIPLSALVRLFAWRPLVDMITRTMFRSDWSQKTRQQMLAMRRHEAQRYSTPMIKLLRRSLSFKAVMQSERSSVPTRLCYANDDTVSGKNDANWYAQRLNLKEKIETSGGHLVILAEPDRLGNIFTRQI